MTTRRWIKSSYSVENGSCVELARTPDTTGVRDSKNPDGPKLAFGHAGWTAFLDSVRAR